MARRWSSTSPPSGSSSWRGCNLHADHLMPQDSPDTQAPADILTQSTPHKGTTQGDSFHFLGAFVCAGGPGGVDEGCCAYVCVFFAASSSLLLLLVLVSLLGSLAERVSSVTCRRRTGGAPCCRGWGRGGRPSTPPPTPPSTCPAPPSPISPPRSLTNGPATPRPPRAISPEDDSGPRSLEGGRNAHHPHHPHHPAPAPFSLPPPPPQQLRQLHLRKYRG
ncbi:mRNA decay activator protein ZFP36L2-like isoform X2 [Scylla paramamosain]|uniref:mRNA decay activator protein ZFP36L2-like isoform X2 n=1 Tax=Scylla paramamosain TaxID=85552 RepID=UPI00308302E7